MLSNTQKDEAFICRVRSELVQNGFAVAVPCPDIIGEDLWFTRQVDAPRLYLAQAKSSWSSDPRRKERQYSFNISLRWFVRAAHQPHFIYVLGLCDYDRQRNDLRRVSICWIPASGLRGKRFFVSKKKGRDVVNLYVKVAAVDASQFTLHNGAAYSAERFTECIDGYMDHNLNTSLSKCLTADDHRECDLTRDIRTLSPPIIGKRQKAYTTLKVCPYCSTEFVAG